MPHDYLEMFPVCQDLLLCFDLIGLRTSEKKSLLPFQGKVKELFAIVLACNLGFRDGKQDNLFMLGNKAVIEVINKQFSKENWLKHLLQRLELVCLSKNMFFKERLIPKNIMY